MSLFNIKELKTYYRNKCKEFRDKLNKLQSDGKLDLAQSNCLDYTNRHINDVVKLMNKLGLKDRGAVHDISKFDPDQFIPYAYYHHGTPTEKLEWTDRYNKVRDLHKQLNEHHPEYWYDKDRVMPFDVWCEMLCDWISCGINTKSDPSEYTRADTRNYYYKFNVDKLKKLPGIKEATEEWLDKYVEGLDFDIYKWESIYDKHIKRNFSMRINKLNNFTNRIRKSFYK